MTQKGLKQLVGDGSMDEGEIIWGNVAAVRGPFVESVGVVGTEEFDPGRTTSVYPGLKPSGNMEASGCEVSSHESDEVDKTLREGLVVHVSLLNL